jgi:uncharacterized protein (TIGR03000 family)
MRKCWFSAVLGTAFLLALPGESSAQRFRRGGWGGRAGNYSWTGDGYGYGRGGYYGSPGYYGSGYGPSYGYSPSNGYGMPYAGDAGPAISSLGQTGGQSFYYSPAAQNPNAALIQVRVPANAEVSFEGDQTTQTGAVRLFQSPELQPGKSYTYDVRASWTDTAGKPVERTKQVKVQAGARASVDFNNP